MGVVGKLSTWMDTVEVLGAHTPLLIFHCNTLVPEASAVTGLVAKVSVVILPLPKSTDQVPTPMAGAFAFNRVVGELMHKVCCDPALAVVGNASLVTVTASVDVGQTPLTTVHKKVLVPVAMLRSEEVAEFRVTIVANPPISDQDPVPTVGKVPVKALPALQITWSLPP